MTGAELAAVGLFGLIIGSFLNVCIARLPAGDSVVFPGSRCPSCRAPIRWYDNLPVFSYVLLKGRCRSCHRPIAVRYPLVELATAVAFVAQAALVGDDPLRLVQRLIFTAMLIVLFGTDLDVQRLPNVITLPGIAIGLLFSIWLPPGVVSAAIGAASGAGILLAIRWAWQRATGVDAMGLGDVKMLAMVGAFLGWQQVFLVLLLGSIVGALLGIALTVGGSKTMQSRLPFGTFLAVAAFVASLIGDRVLDWYVGLLG